MVTFLDILFDGVHWFLFTDFHLSVGVTRDFHYHVTDWERERG